MSENLSQTLSIKSDDRDGLTVADLLNLVEAITQANLDPTVGLKARVGFKGQLLSLETTEAPRG